MLSSIQYHAGRHRIQAHAYRWVRSTLAALENNAGSGAQNSQQSFGAGARRVRSTFFNASCHAELHGGMNALWRSSNFSGISFGWRTAALPLP